jgi:nitronate monooxygenase
LRAAAAKAGSPDVLSLWAGQAIKLARKGAAADIVRDLWGQTQSELRERSKTFLNR